MKFLLILLAIILIIPSSAFAGTWTIRIDQIRPIINYMKRLHPQKQQNSVSHIIKVAVTPPAARDKTRAVKKTKLLYPMKPLTVKFKTKRIFKPRPAVAHIHGSVAGLPVLTVDFVNKPLWLVLQDISSKTGYMFTSSGIDLGKKVNLKGRYNLAKLLAVLFAKDKTSLNLKTKKITIRSEND